jgi:predicted TPR repeat methyltransferase
MNQSGVALPLFKNAIKVNPNTEQFWLSYIEALIAERQFEEAKQALNKGRKKGVAKKHLKMLRQKLGSVKGGGNLIQDPSQPEIEKLLNHYQNGQYGDAEKLAISITEQFPKHQLSWQILGVIFRQTGRKVEAVNANQKAVELSPQDAEARSNLGAILQELGRLEEAKASYTQAIALKPDYVEAHSNLGTVLQKLGKLGEAEASYRQAIALKPDYAEAYSNLGNSLQELGRLDEAETSYTQAIALKPDYALAHKNLGNMLKALGRVEEAEASYTQAIALKPDYVEVKHMLAALSGETTPTAPLDYVERLFDNYAANFEISLIDSLEYKIPTIIAEMILENSESDSLGSIMDLGCGTGLLGVEIKPFCEHLQGIDLSEKMLDEAKKKNIYDELIKGDILAYLSNESLNFDYFVLTDVFIYMGDLSDVFRLIKSRNKPGGKLAFSTEYYDGDGFFLEKSGRYSHSKTYIESLCKKFNYKLSHFETVNLRKEKDVFINGGLYLLDF